MVLGTILCCGINVLQLESTRHKDVTVAAQVSMRNENSARNGLTIQGSFAGGGCFRTVVLRAFFLECVHSSLFT
jgi:hypothetical protein